MGERSTWTRPTMGRCCWRLPVSSTSFLRDHAVKIWADEDWRVDVTDASGLILFVMQIVVSGSAATTPLRR